MTDTDTETDWKYQKVPDADTRTTSLTISNIHVYRVGEVLQLLLDAGFEVEINVTGPGKKAPSNDRRASQPGDLVRVIFDLDKHGNATGTVHPFCSEECRDAIILEHLPGTEYGVDRIDHFATDDLRCETCDRPVYGMAGISA